MNKYTDLHICNHTLSEIRISLLQGAPQQPIYKLERKCAMKIGTPPSLTPHLNRAITGKKNILQRTKIDSIKIIPL